MAKRKNSFDPDALEKLAKAGEDIANKHKNREQNFLSKTESNTPIEKTTKKVETTKTVNTISKKPITKRSSKKKVVGKTVDEKKTLLCRIGATYHKRLKMEAVKQDTTIRNLLEQIIQENIPLL